MGPDWKLLLRPKLHGRRPPRGALLTISAAAAGLLVAAPGSQAGSSMNSSRHPGFHRARASWYYDDGYHTACGFRVKFGVANRTLPCGTKVTFLHAGHRIRATVDDRGPYVAGRRWDLDEHSARALHVTGVQYVWAKW